MLKIKAFLDSAVVEKDVENIYREWFGKYFFGSSISSPYGCDGLLVSKKHDLWLLMELKYDLDFTKQSEIGKVVLQSLFYIKKFEQDGKELPTIVFVGDRNECFLFHTNSIISYLDKDIDWSVAPSSAHEKYPELRNELGSATNPFVYSIDGDTDFADIVDHIIKTNEGSVRLIRITERNVDNVFRYFKERVLKSEDKNALSIFMAVLVNREENFLHPTKAGTLVTKSFGNVSIDAKKFEAFFKHFNKELKPSEKEHLVAICDRLLEDEKRRREGAFFTPTTWVDKAHELTTEVLGDNWKDEYVVWDCACGTGNLTRDYRFKELYCSTLLKEDVDIMVQSRINEGAERFVYDFLNDMVLPEKIRKDFEEKRKVCFFINPPYGTANNMGTELGDHKAGVALTKMNQIMKDNKIGACSQQLYAQFLYRILQLKEQYGNEVTICLFAPTLYMTGGSFKKFREVFYKSFTGVDGFLFQASHFADVASEWGISFTIWKGDQA